MPRTSPKPFRGGFMGGKSSPEYHAKYFQEHKVQFAEYRRRHRGRNPDRTVEHRKARLSNYNLTPAEFERKAVEQSYVCAICGGTNGKMALSVDHDHKCCAGNTSCGKCVRKLLCRRCNTALGLVSDRIDLLLKLIQYLKEHQSAN
jgi:Recombination endonuclease VII